MMMVNPPSCLVTMHAPYSFYSARINLKLLLSNIINQKIPFGAFISDSAENTKL